jgi:hypothetical protein
MAQMLEFAEHLSGERKKCRQEKRKMPKVKKRRKDCGTVGLQARRQQLAHHLKQYWDLVVYKHSETKSFFFPGGTGT